MPTPNLEMTTKPELTLPKWQRVTSQADGLGESPFWHPLEKRLYWLDIPGQRLRRMAMSADLESEQQIEDWPLGEEPGCFAPAAQGGWVMATLIEVEALLHQHLIAARAAGRRAA